MPHLNIYVDDKTVKKVRAAARKEKTSLSKWVRKAVDRSLELSWPEELRKVLGSLEDVDLKRPDRGTFADDAPRGPL